MDGAASVAGQSEWPDELREMKVIDNLLRCPICYEYMDTAMIVPKCSHNYCSLCIRRHISYKTQCPTCTESVTEPELRNNRTLDEMIKVFSTVRSKLVDLANLYVRKAPETTNNKALDNTSSVAPSIPCSALKSPVNASVPQSSIKSFCLLNKSRPLLDSDDDYEVCRSKRAKPRRPRKQYAYTDSEQESTDSDSDSVICTEPVSTPNTARVGPVSTLSTNKKNESSSQTGSTVKHQKRTSLTFLKSPVMPGEFTSPPSGTSTIHSSTQDSSFVTPSSGKKPSLPASNPFPTINTPSHAGAADIKKVTCPVCSVEVPERNINLHLDRCLHGPPKRDTAAMSAAKRKHLPKLVYALMADKDIRKKLAEVGLPTQGDKQTLSRRHQEFTLLYNSQCDSVHPKSASEIVKDMLRSVREKSKAAVTTTSGKETMKVAKGASSQVVETAQKNYVTQHKSQFAKLIAEARESARAQRQKKDADKDKLPENPAVVPSSPGPSPKPKTHHGASAACVPHSVPEALSGGAGSPTADTELANQAPRGTSAPPLMPSEQRGISHLGPESEHGTNRCSDTDRKLCSLNAEALSLLTSEEAVSGSLSDAAYDEDTESDEDASILDQTVIQRIRGMIQQADLLEGVSPFEADPALPRSSGHGSRMTRSSLENQRPRMENQRSGPENHRPDLENQGCSLETQRSGLGNHSSSLENRGSSLADMESPEAENDLFSSYSDSPAEFEESNSEDLPLTQASRSSSVSLSLTELGRPLSPLSAMSDCISSTASLDRRSEASLDLLLESPHLGKRKRGRPGKSEALISAEVRATCEDNNNRDHPSAGVKRKRTVTPEMPPMEFLGPRSRISPRVTRSRARNRDSN